MVAVAEVPTVFDPRSTPMERIPHPTHLKVQDAYGRIASLGGGCCGPQSSCCGGGRAGEVAQGVGYSDAELATLPEGANLGLSCGNPTATAHIQPGEVVVDLGSGGGLDVFLAAKMVGPEGRVMPYLRPRPRRPGARPHEQPPHH